MDGQVDLAKSSLAHNFTDLVEIYLSIRSFTGGQERIITLNIKTLQIRNLSVERA